MSELRDDATVSCGSCAMPLIPMDERDGTLLLECANRHTATVPAPTDRVTRVLVDSWLARRGAHLHAQRERRAAEDDE